VAGCEIDQSPPHLRAHRRGRIPGPKPPRRPACYPGFVIPAWLFEPNYQHPEAVCNAEASDGMGLSTHPMASRRVRGRRDRVRKVSRPEELAGERQQIARPTPDRHVGLDRLS
jgi:hypothetical protein